MTDSPISIYIPCLSLLYSMNFFYHMIILFMHYAIRLLVIFIRKCENKFNLTLRHKINGKLRSLLTKAQIKIKANEIHFSS